MVELKYQRIQKQHDCQGRIMAGLRWWNTVTESGESEWNFESSKAEDQAKFSRAEIQIFWFGLVIFPVIWVRTTSTSMSSTMYNVIMMLLQTCLLFTAFFSFKLKWVVLVVISLVLSGSNLFGYLRSGSQYSRPASNVLLLPRCRMGSSMAGAAHNYVQVRPNDQNVYVMTSAANRLIAEVVESRRRPG